MQHTHTRRVARWLDVRMGMFSHSSEDPATYAARLAEQVTVYEVLAAAVERRHEVFSVLEAAADPEIANQQLQELLHTDAAGAQWVMDLQLRRLAASERARVLAELERLKQELASAR
jgi:DNA gyrase/topoisomerase IV subunit A